MLIGDEVYEDDPTIRDEDGRKERIVRQIVRAVADLHRIRIVHADIHAGNVGLPPPSDEFLTEFLAKPPLEHNVIRKDGKPTPPNLPNRVTEPQYIRYGDGDCKLFDFGYSFRPTPGGLYDNSVFPRGTPLPPEILRDVDKTAHPFKVDSWQLGIFVSYKQSIYCTQRMLFTNYFLIDVLYSYRPCAAF
jgi:serine/threonine protein kinase